jgi:ketosteroid isomerase-like protein
MKSLMAACGLVLLSVSLSAQDPQQTVQAALDKMVAVTMSKDAAGLAAIYHDDLIFGHTSGLTQSKDEVIKAAMGPRKMESFTFEKPIFKLYANGTMALVRNTTHMRYVGEPTNLIDLDTLWVLVKGPQGWQIASRHANRPPAPTKGPQ